MRYVRDNIQWKEPLGLAGHSLAASSAAAVATNHALGPFEHVFCYAGTEMGAQIARASELKTYFHAAAGSGDEDALRSLKSLYKRVSKQGQFITIPTADNESPEQRHNFAKHLKELADALTTSIQWQRKLEP